MEKKFACLFLSLLIIFSCKKEDEKILNEEPIQNVAPDSFQVFISNVTSFSVTLSWEEATDINNDFSHYEIYINDSLIMQKNSSELVTIENLKSGTYYFGKITAKDKADNETSVIFEFTTLEYSIKFDKIFSLENDYSSNSPRGWCIEKTRDGGYILGGYFINDDGIHTLIIKIDSLGNEQWNTKCMNGYSYKINIRQTADEGYIITDNSRLTRLSENGTVIWHYPENELGFGYGYKSLVITPENDYIVLREVTDTFNGNIKAAITKFNDSGELQWEKRFGTALRTYANYIEKTYGSNYMILGTEGIDDWTSDIQLTKIDGEGNILWQNTLEKEGYDFVTQLTSTHDDGFVISGISVGLGGVNSAMIVKIDKHGIEEWCKKYSWNYHITNANSVKQTSEGDYLFCGGNGYSPAEAILVKLDHTGEVLWKKRYFPDDFMDYVWIATDMELTSDNGIIFTGFKTWVWSGYGKEKGIWVYKTNELGE
jgi:hypothetical protein